MTHSTFKRRLAALGALAAPTLFAGPALAHHPLGGETPATAMHGLLSGIGHPVIGLDHLAFVVAVGIAASFTARPLLIPLFFVLATVAGTVVHLGAIDLPAVEAAIALSVAAIGLVLLSGRRVPTAALAALFAVAGLFHGHAYGEAIFGAEATPLAAYLVGFGLTQWAISAGAGMALGRGSRLAAGMENGAARLSGAMVAGAGVLLVSDHLFAALGWA